jgi:hypothetical protein
VLGPRVSGHTYSSLANADSSPTYAGSSGAAQTQTTAAGMFKLDKNLKWKVVQSIDIDQRTQGRHTGRISGSTAHLSLEQLWLSNFTQKMHDDITKCTSAWLEERGKAPIQPGEMMRYFGYWLAMCLNPMPNRKDYFKSELRLGDLVPPPDMARHGMTRDRFRSITECLCFVMPLDQVAADPWNQIRPFIDAWNEAQVDGYTPSWLLVDDESMCRWLGQSQPTGRNAHKPAPSNAHANPHTSLVKRKPDDIGRAVSKTTCSLVAGALYLHFYFPLTRRGTQGHQ